MVLELFVRSYCSCVGHTNICRILPRTTKANWATASLLVE